MSEVTIPEAPISRIEQYFNYLATGDGTLPEYPISRKEQYLAYLCAHRSDGAISILNKNGEVITTTAANVQTTATQYIVTNYGRQPKTLDGLVLTITDAGNDKVLYVYSSTSSAWVNIGVDVDLSQYFTKAETTALLAEKAQKMSVETTLPATAVVNTIYKLNTGGATSASVVTTLPAGTTVGDVISIIWYNGATPATVTITGTMIPFSYTPTANTRSEINAMWDGTNWCLVSNEQAVTASE